MKLPIKIFVYSEVVPADTGGGEVVLFRHLMNRHEIETLVASTSPVANKLAGRIWNRISQSRLNQVTNSVESCLLSKRVPQEVIDQAIDFQPDVILTVAHGSLPIRAVTLSKALKRPLITFFHDWSPEVKDYPSCFRTVVEQRFLDLAKDSAVAFCVSQAMCDRLRSVSNTIHLPPIPGEKTFSTIQWDREQSFTVGYSGNLYDYGPMLGRLGCEALKEGRFLLEIRGADPNWSTEVDRVLKDAGVVKPFVSRNSYDAWLESLDVFLVAQSFESRYRLRMETSFPSKLVEMLRFGKPIIIWGPEYSSAVRWARKTDAAICVVERDASVVVETVEALKANLDQYNRLSVTASRAFKEEFNPGTIQQTFLTAIKDELDSQERIGQSQRCGSSFV